MNIDIENIDTFEKETNYIQLNGGQSMKLQNQIFNEI